MESRCHNPRAHHSPNQRILREAIMTKSPPVIELSWRDENYGSVCAVAAFRNYAGTLDWSDRIHQRFRGCLKRAGFAFHWGRCSYIATSGTREERQHRSEEHTSELQSLMRTSYAVFCL